MKKIVISACLIITTILPNIIFAQSYQPYQRCWGGTNSRDCSVKDGTSNISPDSSLNSISLDNPSMPGLNYSVNQLIQLSTTNSDFAEEYKNLTTQYTNDLSSMTTNYMSSDYRNKVMSILNKYIDDSNKLYSKYANSSGQTGNSVQPTNPVPQPNIGNIQTSQNNTQILPGMVFSEADFDNIIQTNQNFAVEYDNILKKFSSDGMKLRLAGGSDGDMKVLNDKMIADVNKLYLKYKGASGQTGNISPISNPTSSVDLSNLEWGPDYIGKIGSLDQTPQPTHTWQEGYDFCKIGTSTGWRLPTKEELLAYYKQNGTGNFQKTEYWSSTIGTNALGSKDTGLAYRVNMYNGLADVNNKNSGQAVRCVRYKSNVSATNGQPPQNNSQTNTVPPKSGIVQSIISGASNLFSGIVNTFTGFFSGGSKAKVIPVSTNPTDPPNQKTSCVKDVIYNPESYTDNLPLFKAVLNNNANEINSLIKAGADVNGKNHRGWTALILASGWGCKNSVLALLSNGADKEIKALDGWTAVLIASDTSVRYPGTAYTDIISELTKNAVKNSQDISDSFVSAIVLNNEQLLNQLIKSGADVNIKDHNGATPLINAVVNENINAAKLLLKAGANPSLKNNKGRTALDYADVSISKKDFVDLLNSYIK
ncbi:MAG: ankyrin repeat domain-containing protein [bacterium]